MAVTKATQPDTMVISLVGSETYISGEGRQFKKGEGYRLATADALKLLAAKDDYEVRYFKMSEGEATQVSEFVPESPLPTIEEVAASMNDPARSESSYEQGQIDTALESKRSSGKKVPV